MERLDPAQPRLPGEPRRFATTRWSLVLAVRGEESEQSRSALTRLLETYWYPLYAYARTKGQGPDESCDLTQEFMLGLLDRKFIGEADPQRGRFRNFLLTAFERFLVNAYRRESAEKRGGGRTILSLSSMDAEARYRLEPADLLTPQHIYERRWAMTLLDVTMKRLEEESRAAGREDLFQAMKPMLSGKEGSDPYAVLGAQLGMKEGALRTAVHRLRQRFGALLRAEIAETVADPEDVEDELRHLFQLLR